MTEEQEKFLKELGVSVVKIMETIDEELESLVPERPMDLWSQFDVYEMVYNSVAQSCVSTLMLNIANRIENADLANSEMAGCFTNLFEALEGELAHHKREIVAPPKKQVH